MSASLSTSEYASLFGAGGTASASNLLSTLFSTTSGNLPSTPTTFVSSGNPITDLALAQKQQSQGVAEEEKQPVVADTIAAFTKAVAGATSIQQALLNPTVQNVLLTANGLSSYTGDTALVQKLFLSDPNQSSSLVNQLGNSTWLQAVSSFDFAHNGLPALQNPKVLATLTQGYAQAVWENSLNQATPGLANALTFLSQASSITSAYDVLGNYTNFQVVTTAFGIPEEIVNQDSDAQQRAITSQLDIAKLSDPKYVTSITDQYLLAMQSSSTTGANGLTALSVLA